MRTRLLPIVKPIHRRANYLHVISTSILLQQYHSIHDMHSSPPHSSSVVQQENSTEKDNSAINDISTLYHSNTNQNTNVAESSVATNTMRERFCQQCDILVSDGRLTREAANDFILQYDENPLLREILQKTIKMVDKQMQSKIPSYQRNCMFNEITDEMITRVTKKTTDMLNRKEAIANYAEKGTPTKYNLWFEEESTLMSNDVPANVKSEIFKDMQHHRKKGTSAEEMESEKILRDLASKDKQFADYLRKQQSDQNETE